MTTTSNSNGDVSMAFPERQRAHFNSVLRTMCVFAAQAITAPNSVLSEEAY
ncbi:hypothetical protein RchiOBHm_Chr5g0048821 [Rosa chinensis]|uniref:Uncharacterized protein n=1 Tax=Rosa chinensis TaxID=74649 RepID=A0A2P6QEP6_ROSCH|nr:hypothetical protein RchiOBHm_Chr5g0048821 [Rosa chinensis]